MTIESTNAIGAYNAALKRLSETPGNSSEATYVNDFSAMVKNFAVVSEVGKKSEIQSEAAAAGQADSTRLYGRVRGGADVEHGWLSEIKAWKRIAKLADANLTGPPRDEPSRCP